jgi:adenosylmethionine-8-amino-7-oxononanoate aminotransferase
LDGCGGAAVVSIGHCEERVVEAMSAQLRTVGYLHSGAFANQASRIYTYSKFGADLALLQPAEELANLLTENGTVFARALFNSGGSEAAESAIKLARQYHVRRVDLEQEAG